MIQKIDSTHYSDDDGNPTGGFATCKGLSITWQDGPLGRGPNRAEPNGAFVETVIVAAIDRLLYYQDTQFSCRENALALTKLQEALHWLESRTRAREERGVEGTHQL